MRAEGQGVGALSQLKLNIIFIYFNFFSQLESLIFGLYGKAMFCVHIEYMRKSPYYTYYYSDIFHTIIHTSSKTMSEL